MSEPVPTPAPSAAPAPRPTALSIGQMLHLMQLEMDRAIEHGFPISCLMVGLDAFQGEGESEVRRKLLTDAFRTLKRVTFEKKIKGLGLTEERFILALFPHATPAKAGEVAGEMIAGVRARLRELRAAGDERPACTISIGIGHNSHLGPMSFPLLVEEAEQSLALAQKNGGDRHIQQREVESELDTLRKELEKTIGDFKRQSETLTREQTGAERIWGQRLIDKIVATFAGANEQSPVLVRVEKAVLSVVSHEVERWQADSTSRHVSDSQGQVEMLERRVAKLTEHLDRTEAELRRVAAMKSIDHGIASLYDSVQGLAFDENDYEVKKEMLRGIFEANLELQRGAAVKV